MSSRTVLKPRPDVRTGRAFAIPLSRNIDTSVADILDLVFDNHLFTRSVTASFSRHSKRNIVGRDECFFLAESYGGEEHQKADSQKPHIRLETTGRSQGYFESTVVPAPTDVTRRSRSNFEIFRFGSHLGQSKDERNPGI